MSQFAVTIEECPAIRCAGLKVRTTMQKASTDCPALWQKDFGPRMESFPADPQFPQQSYGASVMLDSDNFDYWALMPLAPGADVPDGMDIFTLPAGPYATAKIAGLNQLGDAFTYVYGEWIASQENYTLNMQGVSYELYTFDFMTTGELSIYCPLLQK
ncbi:MAG: GyrI-like domain-containing protein [Planctomycetaceae bacterium]|nr:GyrI-like domain-containing protein [Planctomycetaceae bacterium]